MSSSPSTRTWVLKGQLKNNNLYVYGAWTAETEKPPTPSSLPNQYESQVDGTGGQNSCTKKSTLLDPRPFFSLMSPMTRANALRLAP
ncbi:hypothetical protein J1N35_023681 [Gossypium stocksii]|uniref:Uncharacterized protein n=1 Tax=Gossypium stocksii TaxID=47602 RepID=A0A9D4A458_9ROSI|nr:hypothetical protein J1N35_023681 [Gossypium stocksii]